VTPAPANQTLLDRIDAKWKDRLPAQLFQRLQELIDTPEG
jgi:hypothetical protein